MADFCIRAEFPAGQGREDGNTLDKDRVYSQHRHITHSHICYTRTEYDKHPVHLYTWYIHIRHRCIQNTDIRAQGLSWGHVRFAIAMLFIPGQQITPNTIIYLSGMVC